MKIEMAFILVFGQDYIPHFLKGLVNAFGETSRMGIKWVTVQELKAKLRKQKMTLIAYFEV
jgi:hypothetical protein